MCLTACLLFMHNMLMLQLHANPAYPSTHSMAAICVPSCRWQHSTSHRAWNPCHVLCHFLHSTPHTVQMRPQTSPSTKAANSSVMICMPLGLLELSPPPSPPQSPPDALPEPPSPPPLSVSWSTSGRHLAEGVASQPESLRELRAGIWNAACSFWVYQVTDQCSTHGSWPLRHEDSEQQEGCAQHSLYRARHLPSCRVKLRLTWAIWTRRLVASGGGQVSGGLVALRCLEGAAAGES